MNHSSSQILATATDVFLTFDQAYKHYGASVEADFIAAKQRLDALVAARAANVRQRASAQQSLQALQLQRRDVAAAAAPAAGPSNKYLLKQLDVDAARDIARTWSLLKKMGVQTTLMISRNFANLNQPRKESSGFIG